ncbi:hypothetical protein TTHERM_00155520 (macronuclear) [Tetrahymena thermophila SB210]|uniref:AMP-binding enzyme family protein n=1 Tax=Tetrahymena thermophila (strain SB210) TaxID=312017 RepID=Q22WI4_TETTS|nr:hypothetical protein TTHERM_00155520 [Tetrahymena thermophila SB210]EAR89433.2 hypothetical protein TTHERM_00155520 [Tetrahymena thermophila SB210]|eukprot:XP_001009678.2 hypothetical protein TTHERM_00155520 [Tetrahymena thermophila SB210]
MQKVNQSGYGQVGINIDETVELVQIQYPSIPQILALANSILSLLMLLGYIGRKISQKSIRNDFFFLFLKNIYQGKYYQMLKISNLLDQKEVPHLELNQLNKDTSNYNKEDTQEHKRLDQDKIQEQDLKFLENENGQSIFVPQLDFKSKQSLDIMKSNNFELFHPMNSEQIIFSHNSLFKQKIDNEKQKKKLSNNEVKPQKNLLVAQNAQNNTKYKEFNLNQSIQSIQNIVSVNCYDKIKSEQFNTQQCNNSQSLILINNQLKKIEKNTHLKDEELSKSNLEKLQAIHNKRFQNKLYQNLFGFRNTKILDQIKSQVLNKLQRISMEEQIVKDLNIFELYKDVLFMKKAIMMLFDSDQLAVIDLIGCSSNYLDLNKQNIDQERIFALKQKNFLSHFEEQYLVQQSEQLKLQKLKTFLNRFQSEKQQTELDKRLFSSII